MNHTHPTPVDDWAKSFSQCCHDFRTGSGVWKDDHIRAIMWVLLAILFLELAIRLSGTSGPLGLCVVLILFFLSYVFMIRTQLQKTQIPHSGSSLGTSNTDKATKHLDKVKDALEPFDDAQNGDRNKKRKRNKEGFSTMPEVMTRRQPVLVVKQPNRQGKRRKYLEWKDADPESVVFSEQSFEEDQPHGLFMEDGSSDRETNTPENESQSSPSAEMFTEAPEDPLVVRRLSQKQAAEGQVDILTQTQSNINRNKLSPSQIMALRNKELWNNKCSAPTANNPTQNSLPFDPSGKPPACPASLVEKEVGELVSKGLFHDGIHDAVNKRSLQHTFVSLPNSASGIPDREGFMQWQFGNQTVCRHDPSACVNPNDIHAADLQYSGAGIMR